MPESILTILGLIVTSCILLYYVIGSILAMKRLDKGSTSKSSSNQSGAYGGDSGGGGTGSTYSGDSGSSSDSGC